MAGALYESQRRTFSSQRALLFGVAPHELGVDPRISTSEARAYWNLARAGWCWREVRPSEDGAHSALPTQAWTRRAADGLVGLELASAAAVELARAPASDDVEPAFQAATELFDGPPTDERSLFAFRFGVALHDVEQVMADRGQRYW